MKAPPTSVPDAIVRDRLSRPLTSLRVSVIDRCDLRCTYCMPEEDYTWLPAGNILSFDDICRLTRVFVSLGVRSVRLTGGEPLLRGQLVELVARLAEQPGIEDLAMTTNGTQLERWAEPLKKAGLQRVTISLDSLHPERFAQLTQREVLCRVLAGIKAAADAGFKELKINTVVMRGFNDDEIFDLLEFASGVNAELRFIEYMDVGGATRWHVNKVEAKTDILQRLQSQYGEVKVVGPQGTAPAQRFALSEGTRFGIVASVTEPFCRSCDRGRLTADGLFYRCLYAANGFDLGTLLQAGSDDEEIEQSLRQFWSARTDRAAEERFNKPDRTALYQVDELRSDPHREMHTRGG